MKLFVNRHILLQTVLDSGEITPMMAIMHRFDEPGTYSAVVSQGDNQTGAFTLVVDKDTPEAIAKIDLAAIDCSHFVLNPKVHTVFYAPKATKGYSVLVERCEAKSTVFDSKMLQEGDMFVVTLLRPGCYFASNQQGAKCMISLSRCKTRMIQFNQASQRGVIRPIVESCTVECSASGFRPGNVNIQTAQPLIFMIKAPSRIKIEFQAEEKQETQASQ